LDDDGFIGQSAGGIVSCRSTRLDEIDWALRPFEEDSSFASAPAEQVWNPAYLAWVREANSIDSQENPDTDSNAEPSEDLADFLDWLETQK
jgi:hypothetical protein